MCRHLALLQNEYFVLVLVRGKCAICTSVCAGNEGEEGRIRFEKSSGSNWRLSSTPPGTNGDRNHSVDRTPEVFKVGATRGILLSMLSTSVQKQLPSSGVVRVECTKVVACIGVTGRAEQMMWRLMRWRGSKRSTGYTSATSGNRWQWLVEEWLTCTTSPV